MTLARTALRLQAVRTLLADPVIDALCQGRIYDSRVGDLDAKEPVPTIVITTEEDDAPAYSANNGGVPFDHTCDLVLEIAMTATERDEAGNCAIGSPATDSELEACLDLIEERAVEALTVGDTPEAYLLRTAVTRRVTKQKSSRFSTEQGIRLAIRLVTLTTKLKGEDQRDATVAVSGPYAVLPEPLRSVARAMPAGYSGRITCDLIASRIPLPVETPFAGADLTYASHSLDPASPPDADADTAAGRTYGDRVDLPDWSP